MFIFSISHWSFLNGFFYILGGFKLKNRYLSLSNSLFHSKSSYYLTPIQLFYFLSSQCAYFTFFVSQHILLVKIFRQVKWIEFGEIVVLKFSAVLKRIVWINSKKYVGVSKIELLLEFIFSPFHGGLILCLIDILQNQFIGNFLLSQ